MHLYIDIVYKCNCKFSDQAESICNKNKQTGKDTVGVKLLIFLN